MEILLEWGADVHALTAKEQTPLALASGQGHENIVEELLEKHASLSAVEKEKGRTPLLIACDGGHDTVARLLLQAGEAAERQAMLDKKDLDDMTALMLAAKNGHTRTVRVLLQMGVDPLQKTHVGMTSLILASSRENS